MLNKYVYVPTALSPDPEPRAPQEQLQSPE